MTADRVTLSALSEKQRAALTAAAAGQPIYAETGSLVGAQTPTGIGAFHLRTAESLVTKQLLSPDGMGGYRITSLGMRVMGVELPPEPADQTERIEPGLGAPVALLIAAAVIVAVIYALIN